MAGCKAERETPVLNEFPFSSETYASFRSILHMKSPIFITLLTLKKPSILKCSYFTHWFNCLRLNIGLDPHLFGSNKWWLKNWFSGSRLDVTISTAFFSTIVLISTSKISFFFWDNSISFGSKFWNGTCTKFLLNPFTWFRMFWSEETFSQFFMKQF